MTSPIAGEREAEAFEAAERLPDDAFMQPLEVTSREALIQMVRYYQAQDGLLTKAQDEAQKLRDELAEVQRPLDDQMARLNKRVIELTAQLDASTTVPEGFVIAPDYRGYAHLGTGQYLLNNSGPDGEEPELIISIATEEEKAGRTVGDSRDNPEGHMLQPEAMCVRIRFANVAGLDALEKQLRMLRAECFPESAALLEPVGEGDASLIERLKMEAQIHAQEARTANATIAEIYQIVTGKTGEPGNWHGAEPVRKCIEELRAAIAASPKSNGGMGS